LGFSVVNPNFAARKMLHVRESNPLPPVVEHGGTIGWEDGMYSVDFMDQVGARPAILQANLSFSEADTVSVRELITARIKSEYGKIRDWDSLDPVRLAIYGDHPQVKHSDLEIVIKRATAAFDKRQFLLFVDGHQCAQLEEVVHLKSASKVKFLRITPLKGG
jgi:hypothetical protein